MSTGRLFGVGLGPGDPDLMTVKARKCLTSSPVVAYFCKKGRRGHARTIVDGLLAADVEELPLPYPLTTEVAFDTADYRTCLAGFYAEATEAIGTHLSAGRDVALLCEGDPLFYGSFMHLFVRLRDRFPVTIVPGVSGMSGCWTAANQPMTWGDDVLTVLPATLPAARLEAKLADSDACVILKIGSNFGKVKSALAATGRLADAIYVERGTMTGERVVPLAQAREETAPYFSIILVPGQGRRP